MNSAVNHIKLGEGPPVLLIHGLAASLHDWDALLPALAARGYAGYALDLLGHGESAKPGSASEYTSDSVFAHLAGWVDALALDEPAILVGHSLGGYLSLRFALEFPERVRALVLSNPFYSVSQLPRAVRFFLRQPWPNLSLMDRTPFWLYRALIDASSLQFGNSHSGLHCLPPDVRLQTALDFKRAAPGIYNIPRTLRDLSASMDQIHQPSLVIWGARDQTIDPGTFPTLVKRLPNASCHIMPVCAHVPHQCHAGDYNEKVLEFLGSL